MNNIEKNMYNLSCEVIKRTGRNLRDERKNKIITFKEKSSHMDIVTEYDILTENAIKGEILKEYPNHSFIAEESANDSFKEEGYTWVLDPIDGTLNFYRFGRDYSISLALKNNNNPVIGLVYNVYEDVLFSAIKGEGSFINGVLNNPVPEIKRNRLKDSLAAVSLKSIQDLSGLGADMKGLMDNAQGHRSLGCASLDMLRVANGECDIYMSTNVYEWDVAASSIYMCEMGGNVIKRKLEGSKGKLFVAAYRSFDVWNEVLSYFPDELKKRFDLA